jgi:hypothetical protein
MKSFFFEVGKRNADIDSCFRLPGFWAWNLGEFKSISDLLPTQEAVRRGEGVTKKGPIIQGRKEVCLVIKYVLVWFHGKLIHVKYRNEASLMQELERLAGNDFYISCNGKIIQIQEVLVFPPCI